MVQRVPGGTDAQERAAEAAATSGGNGGSQKPKRRGGQPDVDSEAILRTYGVSEADITRGYSLPTTSKKIQTSTGWAGKPGQPDMPGEFAYLLGAAGVSKPEFIRGIQKSGTYQARIAQPRGITIPETIATVPETIATIPETIVVIPETIAVIPEIIESLLTGRDSAGGGPARARLGKDEGIGIVDIAIIGGLAYLLLGGKK